MAAGGSIAVDGLIESFFFFFCFFVREREKERETRSHVYRELWVWVWVWAVKYVLETINNNDWGVLGVLVEMEKY